MRRGKRDAKRVMCSQGVSTAVVKPRVMAADHHLPAGRSRGSREPRVTHPGTGWMERGEQRGQPYDTAEQPRQEQTKSARDDVVEEGGLDGLGCCAAHIDLRVSSRVGQKRGEAGRARGDPLEPHRQSLREASLCIPSYKYRPVHISRMLQSSAMLLLPEGRTRKVELGAMAISAQSDGPSCNVSQPCA